MISIVIFALILFSGCLLAYLIGINNIYRMVPVTLMFISILMFIFGVFGKLKVGVVFVNLLALIIYVVSIFAFLKNKKKTEASKKLYKPFILVNAVVLFVVVFNRGRGVHLWDEFSHWADVVKAMFYLDDLATNPLSHSMFKDYPPGMSLLQYFFIEENHLVSGEKIFIEWRLYAMWQLVVFSLLFPLFEDSRIKKIELLSIIILLISVCNFYYNDFFESLYIDPVIAVVAAYLLCLIVFSINKDLLYDLSVSLGCVFLVLLKDVGFGFACLISLIYFFDIIFKRSFRFKNILCLFPLISTCLTKCIWRYELVHENVRLHFQSKIDVVEYLNMVIYKNGSDYKQQVVNNAINAFAANRFRIGLLNVSYLHILIFFIIVCSIAVVLVNRKVNKVNLSIRKGLISLTIIFVCALLYSIFIGSMYVYRFSEYEAINLASYERYMNICYLFYTFFSFFLIIYCVNGIRNFTSVIVAGTFLALLLTNNLGLTDYLTRKNISKSKELNEEFTPLISLIECNCDINSKICILSRGDNGLDKLVLKYYSRPVFVNTEIAYSLGGPSFDGDIWYTDISPDEYMNTLLDNGITHVAVKNVGSDFISTYGVLFENVDDVHDNTLFELDKDNRVLILCD